MTLRIIKVDIPAKPAAPLYVNIEISIDEDTPERRLALAVLQASANGDPVFDRDLTRADFSGLDISDLELRDCLLDDALFDGCKIDRLTIDDCTINGASFRNATITRSSLAVGDTAQGVDFTDAKVSGSEVALRLDSPVFHNTDISNTHVTLNISAPDIDGLTIRQCLNATLNIDSATNPPIRNLTASECQFKEFALSYCDVEGYQFLRCSASEGTQFDHCTLSGGEIDRTQFDYFNLDDSTIKASIISNSIFTRACIRLSTLADIEAQELWLPDSVWISSEISGGSYSDLALSNANGTLKITSNAALNNSHFTGAKFESLAFDAAVLDGCDLSSMSVECISIKHSKFTDCSFAGADLGELEADSFDTATLGEARFDIPRTGHP